MRNLHASRTCQGVTHHETSISTLCRWGSVVRSYLIRYNLFLFQQLIRQIIAVRSACWLLGEFHSSLCWPTQAWQLNRSTITTDCSFVHHTSIGGLQINRLQPFLVCKGKVTQAFYRQATLLRCSFYSPAVPFEMKLILLTAYRPCVDEVL